MKLCIFNVAQLLALFSSIVLFVGCAATKVAFDPIGAQDTRQNDPQKSQAMLLASYHAQKKYDLLEREMLQIYEQTNNDSEKLGHLFICLDLAEFYIYGFINYKKSLALFTEAELLNEQLRETPIINGAKQEPTLTYYKASGKYLFPRPYNSPEITKSIKLGRKRISRIYSYQSQSIGKEIELPAVTPLITNNYGFAIQVDRDILDPSQFSRFEKLLIETCQNYFKQRHKLPVEEHQFFIDFNIVRGLITVFDFSSLSQSQVETIFNYVKKLRRFQLTTENEIQNAYIDYVEVLCLTELNKIDQAITTFENFQHRMAKISLDLENYLKSLQEQKNEAKSWATFKTASSLAILVLTMGQAMAAGGGFYLNFVPAGLNDFTGTVATIQRQITLTGESEYSKDWSLILDANDQLQLFRAAGKLYHIKGNTYKSITYNREAVDIISSFRSTITTEAGRTSFAGYRDQIYRYLITDLFQAGKKEEAFYYAENSRARALVDLLGSKAEISFGDQDKNRLVERVKEVQVYRDSLRSDIAISEQQVSYINNLEHQIGLELYRGGDSTNSSISESSQSNNKELLSLITVSNLDYQQIQKLLPSGSSIVEYFVGDKNIFAWIIDQQCFQSISLESNSETIKKDVYNFIKFTQNGPHTPLELQQKLSKKIYQQLFQPLEKHLKTDSVYLIAHDFLHFLPFDALYTGEQYLVEKYALASLPSSSILQFLEPIGNETLKLLSLGNPTLPNDVDMVDLPGAEEEAKRIGALFRSDDVYTRNQATETTFRTKIGQATITHIASHAIFDEQNALNSRVFLAKDNINDGQLLAYEIYDIPKVSELITLSACETAKSEISSGDELIGLMRGLFYSGASSIVASLWVVEDISTLKLMESFYTNMLFNKKQPIYALQSAKKQLLASKEYNSPFFWSSFNLYGFGI